MRKDVFKELDQIRNLRNRIAHHEPILTMNLKQQYNSIIKVIDWICPITAICVHKNNNFSYLFQKYEKKILGFLSKKPRYVMTE